MKARPCAKHGRLGGCSKPHMVCRDGRRWCVEDGGRILLSDLHIYNCICNPQFQADRCSEGLVGDHLIHCSTLFLSY
ncbi:hypothetical protein EPI10_028698 [Gossypium australe]|uniref:EGF-like domain-containing protein n=1 Tax=Gossypium australe TaxID=47621 RepID=A0A5B6V000_9ROSI|nr:hypothetical protein EPI10_028698 [Gossypium australe]